jgi:pyruvate dehydrogenase E2 component (dihydrolipoamide acetyltransferase)
LRVAAGDKVSVGDLVAIIDAGDAAPAAVHEEAPAAAEPAPAAAEAPAPAAPAATGAPVAMDIVVPNLGEGVEGGDVQTMYVSAGDQVEEGQGLLELETGKATVDLPAERAGKITSLTVAEGARISVGDIIGTIEAVGAAAPVAVAPAATPATPAAPAKAAAAPAKAAPKGPKAPDRPKGAPLPASPSVRKFAREIGINLHDVAGSGVRGRISIGDVKAYSKAVNEGRSSGSAATGGSGFTPPPLPDFETFGPIRKEAMNTIRKMTVDHMKNAWLSVPHVTQHDYADITDLEAMRKSFQPKAEAAGTKLTVTAMLMKIMASALKVFPNFNASIDVVNEEVIYKNYFHVGCAVDTPNGLVVPVVRDIERKNMIEVAKDLGELAGKMRDGKIAPKDIQGGSITLSNLGGLGGKHFTPIVNIPEVAILGVGRASMQPVWQGDKFVPRLMMPLSLSYDHRLIDGADGTRFLRWIIDAIEQPLLISLEG